MKTLPGVVVSRCDRIGDLVLSLPALGLLRDAGVKPIVLHCSAYCRDVGELARFNGLCDAVWPEGDPLPRVPAPRFVGLALFHDPAARRAFAAAGAQWTLGPRTKLSALWSYSRSVAQHRSRVEKSEMRYNLDLARATLAAIGAPVPPFRGLPALRLPTGWTAPFAAAPNVLIVSNRGSADNWPVERYVETARALLARGEKVDLVVSGNDAAARRAALRATDLEGKGARLVGDFASLRELVAYLASATRVVSSSTGPLHLAHALGKHVEGIYPRVRVQSFERWRPDGYWHAGELRFSEL